MMKCKFKRSLIALSVAVVSFGISADEVKLTQEGDQNNTYYKSWTKGRNSFTSATMTQSGDRNVINARAVKGSNTTINFSQDGDRNNISLGANSFVFGSGSTFKVKQKNDHNSAEINAGETELKSGLDISIDQQSARNGGINQGQRTALVTDGANDKAVLKQRAGSGSGLGNLIDITSMTSREGGSNTFDVMQDGSSNQFVYDGDSSDMNTFVVDQLGELNAANVTLGFADNSSVRLMQDGDRNTYNLAVTGIGAETDYSSPQAVDVRSMQHGDLNSTTLNLTQSNGVVVRTDQDGDRNVINANFDAADKANLTQEGDFNTIDLLTNTFVVADILQDGNRNSYVGKGGGYGHTLNLKQIGDSNSVETVQKHGGSIQNTMTINQIGSFNTAFIEQ